jgi:hypothetical protein
MEVPGKHTKQQAAISASDVICIGSAYNLLTYRLSTLQTLWVSVILLGSRSIQLFHLGNTEMITL